MNTDNFLIEEREIEFAQNVCKLISDTNTRNRAVANAFGASIAEKFFDKDSYKVDNISGLHNIGQILDKFDISDIYINNSYIDVRLFFSEDELSVPKSHFDNNLLPVAYMFVRITPDLSNATVTGFIASENVDTTQDIDGFYPVKEDQLVSFYDIEPLLVTKEDSYAVEESEIFAFLDNKVEDRNAFIRELIASENGRLKFAKAVKAQYAFNFISFNNEDNASDTQELDLSNDDFTGITEDDLLDLDSSAQDNSLLEEPASLEDSLEESFDNVDAIDMLDAAPLEEVSELGLEGAADLTADALTEFGEEIGEADSLIAEDDNVSAADELDIIEDVPTENEDDSGFEFSTVTTPSLDTLSDNLDNLLNEENSLDIVDEITEHQEVEQQAEIQEQNTVQPQEEVVVDTEDVLEEEPVQENPGNDLAEDLAETTDETNDNTEQIDTLFNTDEQELADENLEFVPPKKQKSSIKLLAIVGLLVVLGAVGYFGYNQFANQQPAEDDTNLVTDSVETQQTAQQPAQSQEEAMPVESVENVAPKLATNEGTSESIPAIEQNLDASILVSNLKVDWEVPAGYASNTSAKRYLVKLGKIIQLNLKTELLLLNKPPISNKIAVEIKYNSGTKKFEATGITQSSGEKTVDNLILQTVNKALAMNLSTNFDSFSKLQGNPVLIIHL